MDKTVQTKTMKKKKQGIQTVLWLNGIIHLYFLNSHLCFALQPIFISPIPFVVCAFFLSLLLCSSDSKNGECLSHVAIRFSLFEFQHGKHKNQINKIFEALLVQQYVFYLFYLTISEYTIYRGMLYTLVQVCRRCAVVRGIVYFS